MKPTATTTTSAATMIKMTMKRKTLDVVGLCSAWSIVSAAAAMPTTSKVAVVSMPLIRGHVQLKAAAGPFFQRGGRAGAICVPRLWEHGMLGPDVRCKCSQCKQARPLDCKAWQA